jgi:hypothetical protein
VRVAGYETSVSGCRETAWIGVEPVESLLWGVAAMAAAALASKKQSGQ